MCPPFRQNFQQKTRYMIDMIKMFKILQFLSYILPNKKMRAISFIFFALLAIIKCSNITQVLDEIIKTQNDYRTYRGVRLSNGIECLIISDPEAKISSAALSVTVGWLSDPWQKQGLSHFLQHTLFMGNKKYPEENDYTKFIQTNSGELNAFTMPLWTSYYFQISNLKFKQALDRLANFFIDPLFREEAVQRELQAINSQHMLQFTNDTQRMSRIKYQLAREGHPFQKYFDGNKQFLYDSNLSSVLSKHFQKYSSNLMKLVVYSHQTLDDLQQMVEELFQLIPNKNYNKYQLTQVPYGKQQLKKMVKISPVHDVKKLQFYWVLTDKSKYYRYPPASYVSYLMNNQQKGSLGSFLRKLGLIFFISASSFDQKGCFSTFRIEMDLTKKGVENVKLIIDYVLYYIQFMEKTPPQKWIHEQIKILKQIQANYSQPHFDMDYTNYLVQKMQTTKIQEVLISQYMMEQWRPDLIKQYVKELRLQNLIVFLQAKQVQVQCNLTQRVYKTKYGVFQLNGVEPKSFPVLLPRKNPFLPTNFTQQPLENQTIPILLYKSQQLEAFYKKDHQFGQPKTVVKIMLYFNGNCTQKQNFLRFIYQLSLNEKNKELQFLGITASISSLLQRNNYFSFDVKISGFRDSVSKFIKPYLEEILNFEVTDSKSFQNIKQVIKRTIHNYLNDDPLKVTFAALANATSRGIDKFSEQYLSQLDAITFEDSVNFSRVWKEMLFAEAYITGNLDQNQAKTITTQMQKLLKRKSQILPKSKIGETLFIKIPINTASIIEYKLSNKQQLSQSIVFYFQYDLYTPRGRVMADLCYNIFRESVFDYLRTKEQLGYTVLFYAAEYANVLGILLMVKGQVKTSYEMAECVDNYFKSVMPERLSQIEQKQFEQQKQSLKLAKSQNYNTLDQQASSYSQEIFTHQYAYDRKQKQIEQIDKITLDQFKKFIGQVFYEKLKKIEILGMTEKGEGRNEQAKERRLALNKYMKVYTDFDVFTSQQQYYPYAYGYKYD